VLINVLTLIILFLFSFLFEPGYLFTYVASSFYSSVSSMPVTHLVVIDFTRDFSLNHAENSHLLVFRDCNVVFPS
jgi:hypothetical protein